MISSRTCGRSSRRSAPTRRCDRLAELSALFHAAGSLHLRGKGEWAIHLDARSGAAARRAFAAPTRRGAPLRDPDVPAARAFDQGDLQYQLHLHGDDRALDVLVAAGILDGRHAPLERPPRRVVARACCRSAYVRGAFLGGGTLSIRRSAHVELRTATPRRRLVLQEVAAEAGIGLDLVERSSHHAAYAKAWDEVESVLALTGAAEAVLALEERVVLAATREQANRLANADPRQSRPDKAGPLGRSSKPVEFLRAERRLEDLSIELREAAELPHALPGGALRGSPCAHGPSGEQGRDAAAAPPARGSRAAERRRRCSEPHDRRYSGLRGLALPAAADRAPSAVSPVRGNWGEGDRPRSLSRPTTLPGSPRAAPVRLAADWKRRDGGAFAWPFASVSAASAASGGTSSGRSMRSARTSRSSR